MTEIEGGRQTERERDGVEGDGVDVAIYRTSDAITAARSETPFNPVYLINNAVVLLKQPKHAGKGEERPPTGEGFQFIWGQKLLLGFHVVNILFGPH